MLQECVRNNQHARYTRKCLAGKVCQTMYKSIHAGGWRLGLLATTFLFFFFLAPFALQAHVYDPMHL